MPGILLSGPAGSGKSQLARDLLRETTEPTVAADFQAVVGALLLLERGPDGKYPVRPSWVVPLAERIRQAVISAANERGISLVITNSDGDLVRRQSLLARLGSGPDAERIVDPGYDVVAARLADPETGVLSEDCEKAINRWYRRVNRG